MSNFKAPYIDYTSSLRPITHTIVNEIEVNNGMQMNGEAEFFAVGNEVNVSVDSRGITRQRTMCRTGIITMPPQTYLVLRRFTASVYGYPFSGNIGGKYHWKVGIVNDVESNNWDEDDGTIALFTDDTYLSENDDTQYSVVDYCNTSYPPIVDEGENSKYIINVYSNQTREVRFDIMIFEGETLEEGIVYFDEVSADAVNIFAKFQIEKY